MTRLRLRGMTLAEVLVSMSFLVILVGLSGSMIVAGLNIFYRAAQLRAAQQEGALVFDLIAQQLETATGATVQTVPDAAFVPDADTRQLVLAPQSLTLARVWEEAPETAVLLDADAFGAHTVRAALSVEGTAALTLSVFVYDSTDALLYTRTGTIFLLNAEATAFALPAQGEKPADRLVVTCQYRS